MKIKPCGGPISRRSFLTLGTLGVAGLSLGDVMRLRASEGRTAAPETSVIFIWLAGGPPHLDMYDMKPDAPDEYRGPFRPIRSNVPGVDVCELMPLHARCADKYALIRSITHTFSDHGGGSKRVMTGRIPATPTAADERLRMRARRGRQPVAILAFHELGRDVQEVRRQG